MTWLKSSLSRGKYRTAFAIGFTLAKRKLIMILFFIILASLVAVRVWAAVEYAKFLDENPASREMLVARARRYGGALC